MSKTLSHKVTFNPLIDNFSGKFKEITMVKSPRGVYARPSTEIVNTIASEKQKEHRELFKKAQAKALADMNDAAKKAEWTRAAKISNGKYLSARSAAFAYYYDELKNTIG